MPRANRTATSRVTHLAPSPARILPPKDGSPLRLRLAGPYQAREAGFLGVDRIKTDAIDYVVDLKSFPWPLDDSVVDTIFAAFYFQRLTNPERWAFMNECCRVLKPGCQVILVVPHESSMRATTDPLAMWPPLNEASFMVYLKAHREQERLTDLPITCDFGGNYGYGHQLDPDISVRNEDYQQLAKKHWRNAITDLHVTLTKQG